MKHLLGTWCRLATVCLVQILFTEGAAGASRQVIPLDQIGAVANQQYSGEGLSVLSSPEGAQVRCVFQRLDARATADGLWLTSMVDGAKGEPFRVVARSMGRGGGEDLPNCGKVEVEEKVARFVRPGLTEEYRVSVDGVQQDFVVEQRPQGSGNLRVGLDLEGAKAAKVGDGVQLELADGGRKITYNRLKAEDARGKEVKARLEVVSASHLTVVLEDTEAEYPVRIDPTFSDANWLGLGGVPGVDGYVQAAVFDGAGNLYVGGVFGVAGNVMANNIAKWDGNSWSALGSGTDGDVYALAVSGTTLYAGGAFTKAGGVSATNIAKWNGTAWSAFGSGMNSDVYALAVSGGTLYAGGDFTSANGVTAYYIAQWNGSSWSALGYGMNNDVYALAISGGTLYAGGYFTFAGTAWATNIAQWNGSSWSALGTGMSGAGIDGNGPYVSALALSGSTLYAGGDFTKAGGVSATNIAQWKSGSWSALGTGISGFGSDVDGPYVWCLAVLGTNLYAGGTFTLAGGLSANSIAQWNGSSWSALSSGMSVGNNYASYVYALASGTNLYAGGIFTMAGGAPTDGVALWNGSSWSNLGSGMNSLVWALAVSGNTLYAGGDFITAASGVWAYGVAQWNGSSWSGLGSGMDNDVYALAVSSNTLYAGGNFTWAGGARANGIARWNGTAWSSLGSGMSGAGIDGYGPYVSALAVSDTNLYAGGDFTRAGGVSATNIAQWNGSAWSALGSGISGVGGNGYGPYVSALAVGTNLYAGGDFTRAGGVSATNIAQWNGSAWSALGTGISGVGGNGDGPYVSALAMSSNTLYAGGDFTKAGGVSAANIARWSGSAWSALGSGISGSGDAHGPYVSALAVSGTNLYVGGDFSMAGAVAASGIAQWNGSSWSALGSGISGGYGGPQVYALAVSGSLLYAGGWFAVAGTNISAYLAEAVVGPTPPFVITTNSNFGFTNGLTQFGFDVLALGDMGQKLVIDASTNLSNWAPVQTNVLSGSLYHFIDKYPTNFTVRFYRAKVSP